MKRLMHPGVYITLCSMLFTLCLWNSCDSMTTFLSEWLNEKSVFFGNWAVYHGVVACSYGLIPLVAYGLFRFGLFKHHGCWLFFMIGMFLLTTLFVVVIGKSISDSYTDSNGFRHYTLHLPFERFWDYALSGAALTSALLAFLAALVYRIKTQEDSTKKSLIDSH